MSFLPAGRELKLKMQRFFSARILSRKASPYLYVLVRCLTSNHVSLTSRQTVAGDLSTEEGTSAMLLSTRAVMQQLGQGIRQPLRPKCLCLDTFQELYCVMCSAMQASPQPCQSHCSSAQPQRPPPSAASMRQQHSSSFISFSHIGSSNSCRQQNQTAAW